MYAIRSYYVERFFAQAEGPGDEVRIAFGVIRQHPAGSLEGLQDLGPVAVHPRAFADGLEADVEMAVGTDLFHVAVSTVADRDRFEDLVVA